MADYKKQINTEVTFTPTDTLLTSYLWKVNGTQESTTRIFKKTFTSLGIHTVTLEGSNSCGNCTPVSVTIEITSEPPLKWKCSDSPNYICAQASDGTYNTEAECKNVCKTTPPSNNGIIIPLIGIGLAIAYFLNKKK